MHNNNDSLTGLSQCEICKRSFGGKRELGIHMSYHSKERTSELNSKCPTCGKYFRYVQTLERHKRKYCKDPRVCECTLCGKHFANTGELQKHVDIHRDSLSCKISNITSKKMMQDADEHLASVTDKSCKIDCPDKVDAYQCLNCKKQFEKKEESDRHVLICLRLQAVNFILDSLS